MRLFSNSRAKRNTALAMLLVWLFALAAGVANACLLEPPGPHGHGAKTLTSGAVPAAPHGGVAAVHDNEPELSKAPCVKFCDGGSQSPVKHQTTLDPSDPSPALLVAVIWTAPVPVLSAQRRMAGLQPATSGLPMRLRYSRLTL